MQKIAEANLANMWSICQNFTSKRKQVCHFYSHNWCNHVR